MSEWFRAKDKLPEIPAGYREHPDPLLYISKITGILRAGYYGEFGRNHDKYFRTHDAVGEALNAEDVLCWMWQHDLPKPPTGDLW